MSFLAGLTTIPTSNPPPWQMLAYALLTAATGYGQSQVTAWRQWAGGSWQQFIDNSNFPAISNVSMVGDESSAVIAYDGTKDTVGLLTQIAGSVQLPFETTGGRVGAGQQWMWFQNRQALLTALQANIPAGSRVVLTGHSMGGALATMMASWLGIAGYIPSIITFGQPRVGDKSFLTFVRPPWLRVINDSDLVTTIPPEVGKANILLGALVNALISYQYSHGGNAWSIGWNQDGTPFSRRGGDVPTLQAAGLTAAAYVTGGQFGVSLANVHPLLQYINVLNALAALDLPNIFLLPALGTMYQTIYGVRTRTPPPAPNPAPIPNGNLLPDPNVIVPLPPGPIAIPPADRGLRVENRQQNVSPNPPLFNTPILSVGVLPVATTGTFQKVTFLFTQLNQGWSETYYLQADSPAAALAATSIVNPGQTKVNTLAAAMMSMRGPQCFMQAVRISQVTLPVPYPKPRISQLYRFTPAKAGSFTGIVTDADFFDTCIVLQMLSAGPNPPKLTHMRGIPDSFVTAGGQPSGTMDAFFGAAWNGPQTGLRSVLQGDAWFWLGQGTLRKSPITNLTQDLPGTVTITTTDATLLNGLTVGAVYPFRISGVTKPKAINGQWPFVVNAGSLSITTKKLFGILAWDSGSQGKITYNPQQAVQIATVRYNNIGERKAGRPSDLQRGRRPALSRN